MDKKNALKKKTKPVEPPAEENYNIENPESLTRRPGMSPEEHEFINNKEKETEPATEPNVANYTGKYGAEEVNSFNGRLAEIVGKRESKGEPVNLVKQAESQKDYAGPYAKNISDLLKRYQEASEAKAKEENKGGAWSMVVGNALGPEAGRATLQAWQSGADEGVENLDRQQRAQQNQIKSDDSLFALARKARAADPNSPLSKALTEYERKTTGFGLDSKDNQISGLSAQDTLDSGKGVINPVFGQIQQTARTDQTNRVKQEEGEANRGVKVSEGSKNRGAAQQRTETMAKAGIARSALAQDTSSASGAAKAGEKAGQGAITLPDNLLPLVPGDQKHKQIVPQNSSSDQVKRMREVAEFSSKAISSLSLLKNALMNPDSSRFERIFEAARSEAMQAAEQYKAGALQADTKLNDNGVVNPADLTLGNQSIFGLDPASARSLLKSNPDLARVVDNQIQAVKRGFSDSVKINNYLRGSQSDVMNQAAGNFRSNSAPVYQVDPSLLGEFGIQKAAQNQSIAPNQSIDPNQSNPVGMVKILIDGQKKTVSAKAAAVLVKNKRAQYAE